MSLSLSKSIPLLCSALAALALVGCGGNAVIGAGSGASGTSASGAVASTGDAGNSTGASGSGVSTSGVGDAAAATGSSIDSGTPIAHRPTAIACSVTNVSEFGQQDAGTVSCMTDSDCQGGASYTPYQYCLHNLCRADQCLIDSDCSSDSVCACADQFTGNALHTNLCVLTGCHVDADCPSGLCSPAGGQNLCLPFSGYRCRSAMDTCQSNGDCAGSTNGTGGSCSYDSTSGHWQCESVCTIAG